MREAIELPFGVVRGVGPRNGVVDGGLACPWVMGSFGGFFAHSLLLAFTVGLWFKNIFDFCEKS